VPSTESLNFARARTREGETEKEERECLLNAAMYWCILKHVCIEVCWRLQVREGRIVSSLEHVCSYQRSFFLRVMITVLRSVISVQRRFHDLRHFAFDIFADLFARHTIHVTQIW